MIEDPESLPPRQRGIFCNRTLNLRAIRAIGYDMDYTLVHYLAEEWERKAYEHIQRRLVARGWPVDHLRFDPSLQIQGLVIDTALGNLLKANRFGFVKRASHGTAMLDHEAQRGTYARVMVDLAERRYVFLNTLFSLSEACMYAQCVDLLDDKKIPEVLGYPDLYQRIRTSLDGVHTEGELKEEIMADPDRYTVLDPETPLALIDQRESGKKLMLITNSEWRYTTTMMSYAFDRFLPSGTTWRDLFDLIIVGARKPEFFSAKSPLFEVVGDDGLLRPAASGMRTGGWYFGGHAGLVEQHLGLCGEEILYVGDHIFGDVRISKSSLRWRTALVLRELETEIGAVDGAHDDDAHLSALMAEKERLEHSLNQLRLKLQRRRGRLVEPAPTLPHESELIDRMGALRTELTELDRRIAPLAKALSELMSPRWGLLLRAGNDKSHLARQLEKSADIYTSRVSNFLLHTPYVYIRSPRGSLPHDPSGTLGK